MKKLFTYLFAFPMVAMLGCNPSENGQTSQADQAPPADLPNIVLIMTDDQGFGDIGYNGNPYVRTPTLDAMAGESSKFTQFYVSPVCAPTRSSLMTGRFSIRTGVYDTYNGGAIMATEEVTIAEILAENGYRTGIFGKWHLGDNYPFRPQDQGFQESLIHPAGGMGQVGDIYNYYKFDSSYFDPTLLQNGQPVETKGYCSDVFTDGAIEFIRSHKEGPFFTYLAYNAPHTPLQLPQDYYDMYAGMEFDPEAFAVSDHYPEMRDRDAEDARKVYGMVTNIDDNFKKLMDALEEEGLRENTIVIFLTDNGSQQNRYRGGLRQNKGSVFEGGVRVPCFMHFPKKYGTIPEINSVAAHIDLLPTLLDFAGIALPDSLDVDGMSLRPALSGDATPYQDRTLYYHWRRGFPDKYWNVAIRQGDFKLVGNTPYNSPISEFELFDISQDPYEQDNLVAEMPEKAEALKKQLDAWMAEAIPNKNTTRNLYAIAGTDHENPMVLNRNDAKGPPGIWAQNDTYGYWDVAFAEAGNYTFRVHLKDPMKIEGTLHLELSPYQFTIPVSGDAVQDIVLENVPIEAGEYKFEPYVFRNGNLLDGESRFIFPFYVEVERVR